jgi:hypothetical protein
VSELDKLGRMHGGQHCLRAFVRAIQHVGNYRAGRDGSAETRNAVTGECERAHRDSGPSARARFGLVSSSRARAVEYPSRAVSLSGRGDVG